MTSIWFSYFESKVRLSMKVQCGGVRTAAHAFRCPECQTDLRPANVQCIVCTNCWHGGTKETFSAIVRAA